MTYPSGSGAFKETPAFIKVLVVDDSAFMRFTIAEQIKKQSDMKVVGSAKDGAEALELIPRLQPDVVTLDIEMPIMDGLTTLREIMTRFPRPVIMLSSLTTEGASETVQALTLGAVDFVAKPANKANVALVMDEAIAKIRSAAGAHVIRGGHAPAIVHHSPVVAPVPSVSTMGTGANRKVVRSLQRTDRVVVIGSSTGGPRALNTVVPAIPADLSAAYLIVQHMPAGFTKSLAERLDTLSPLRVKEAEAGDVLSVGQALMAPGGFHMTVDDRGVIGLNKNPTIHGVRPSVDVTLTSVAQIYGAQAIGVILTGMGRVGANGCLLIHAAGGKVIAEDESSCVVWGMPRAVVEAGAADEVVPLQDVARSIEKMIR